MRHPQYGTRKQPIIMGLFTALHTAKAAERAIWCRPSWCISGAYHVYPGGRIVGYNLPGYNLPETGVLHKST